MTFDRLFINTGAEANLPKIDALVEGGRIFTSKTLLAQKQQIKKLAILGGGPIGLEFASMYTHFGSEVTVIEAGQKLLPRFEPECGQYLCTR